MSTHSDTDSADTYTFEHPTPPNEESTDGENVGTTDKPRLFGGLSASEAGQRSAQKRAERALAGETLEAEARRDDVLVVRTSVEVGKVIDKLAKDAKGGNVQAARELRSWLSELPVEADTDLTALDKRTRQALLARLVAEIEAEQRTAPNPSPLPVHEREVHEHEQHAGSAASAAPIASPAPPGQAEDGR